MKFKTAILASALALGLASVAAAQEDPYPNRPVRLIAGGTPGGNPDVMGRLLAEKFSNTFGKPFVVENIPAASGVVAANIVAKSAPDGHVLMLGDSGALAINSALNPNLSYHPVNDYTPITALVTLPTIMVAHPSVPANTLAEFVALAKQQPGKMTYGSAGPGSIHHFTMAIFADRAGIDLQHVPYRGGSAMVNGLLGGEIQLGWSGIPNVKELIAAGRLRGYCISIPQRSPSVPDIATCDELGYKSFDIATMMGLQGPPGIAPRVVARLQAETAAAMRDPAMTARMSQLGMVMQERGTAHYAQFMKDDMERYAAAVKKLHLQIRQ